MRCFGVQYCCIFLLVLCILTCPVGLSKYCRTLDTASATTDTASVSTQKITSNMLSLKAANVDEVAFQSVSGKQRNSSKNTIKFVYKPHQFH